MMKLYIIAGEASGDFIGGKIIEALKNLDSNIIINGIGGDKMIEAGLRSLFDIRNINLMGFFEILPHIFRIKKLIKQTVEDLQQKQPQILVTIDSPGFTMRVAKEVKKQMPHIKLIHIVAPSVWAYKPGRAQKYANIYDHLLTLLPFEPPYFSKEGLKTDYIGHPILEQKFYSNSIKLRQTLGFELKTKIISITPGSRASEISRHMPIIKNAMNKLSEIHDIKLLFIQANNNYIQTIKNYLTDVKFSYSIECNANNKLKLFAISDVALAKSGTNTLEIAASKTPMIIGYKVNFFSYLVIRALIKIKFVCLINIIPNRSIIPEFLQQDFNERNITNALQLLLESKKNAKTQIQEANEVLQQMGLRQKKTPSVQAAMIIYDYLRNFQKS